MCTKIEKYKREGISRVAFGDLFLEDIRKYREEKIEFVGSSDEAMKLYGKRKLSRF